MDPPVEPADDEKGHWRMLFFLRHSPVHPANPSGGDDIFEVRDCLLFPLDPPVEPADDERRKWIRRSSLPRACDPGSAGDEEGGGSQQMMVQ